MTAAPTPPAEPPAETLIESVAANMAAEADDDYADDETRRHYRMLARVAVAVVAPMIQQRERESIAAAIEAEGYDAPGYFNGRLTGSRIVGGVLSVGHAAAIARRGSDG